MRVHHLISSSGLYGAEKMVVNLSQAQRELGNEATIIVFDNAHSPNHEVADFARSRDVPVMLLPCRGRFDARTVRQLRRILHRDRPDILHVHGFKANLYGYLASRMSAVTLVGTCHRFDQEPENRFDGPLQRRFAGVAAVSDEAAQSLRSVYRIPTDRVVSIPNGIDLTVLDAVSAPGPDRDTVALVGRLAPEKAPADFLAVAANLSRTHPNTRFIVAGDGPMRAELEDESARMGLDRTVEFLGFQDDMPALYQQITVLLQPSLREGMPMTTLEAMASGVAVVATGVGALPDVIEDGRTGYLIEPHDIEAMADRVRRLLDDATLRAQIIEVAKRVARTSHNARVMAEAYRDFYTKALSSR